MARTPRWRWAAEIANPSPPMGTSRTCRIEITSSDVANVLQAGIVARWILNNQGQAVKNTLSDVTINPKPVDFVFDADGVAHCDIEPPFDMSIDGLVYSVVIDPTGESPTTYTTTNFTWSGSTRALSVVLPVVASSPIVFMTGVVGNPGNVADTGYQAQATLSQDATNIATGGTIRANDTVYATLDSRGAYALALTPASNMVGQVDPLAEVYAWVTEYPGAARKRVHIVDGGGTVNGNAF